LGVRYMSIRGGGGVGDGGQEGGNGSRDGATILGSGSMTLQSSDLSNRGLGTARNLPSPLPPLFQDTTLESVDGKRFINALPPRR
jgi:hypothetical protein